MILPKKSKFCKHAWFLIKKNVIGSGIEFRNELHHCCGKPYEKLAYLKVMSVNDHRGNGHKKYIYGIPEDEAKQNIAYWKQLLKDDFKWFEAESLVCD